MSAKVFFYCLKVWLASVLIGPVLFWFCLMRLDDDASYNFPNFLGFWGYAILYGIGFSLLSFLVFLIAETYIARRDWPWHRRRTITAILGILLTLIPFLIFLGTLHFFKDAISVAFCLSYLLPVLAGIYFYRFPQVSKH